MLLTIIGGAMNHVIKLVAEYQVTESEYIFELLVIELKGIINHYNNKIEKFYREDLYQELLYRLFMVIKKFKFKTIERINSSLFTLNTLNILEENNFKKINVVFNNKYLSGFIDKYGKELIKEACLNEDKIEKFLYEFNMFSNENQFFDYLNKALYRETVYFYRKNHIKENNEIISLNTIILEGIEMINTISNDENDNREILHRKDLLSNDDLIFLSNFYDKKRILSGKEVANKLGITQQAVSSRLKRLRKRYFERLLEYKNKVEK